MPRAGVSYRNSGWDNVRTVGPGRICRQAVRRGLVHVNPTAVPWTLSAPSLRPDWDSQSVTPEQG